MLVALREVVALEHARHVVLAGDLDEPRCGHLAEPARIEVDDGALGIEDLEDLLLIGERIALDLRGA